MKMPRGSSRSHALLWRWTILFVISVGILNGCAAGPRLINHAFEFNAKWDSPGIQILDYRYGTSKQPGASACPTPYSSCKIAPQQVGISGDMLLGEDLYVKWRIKSTGQVHQDTVNLANRLPADMRGKRIYFIVRGPQLYVFVIYPERLIPNPCPSTDERRKLDHSAIPYDNVFSMFCSHEITTIYPDQPATQPSN